MAAPTYAVSQTLTMVAGTEQHISNTHIYDIIAVDNSGDQSGTGLTANNFEVYLCFDGGTATVGGAHCVMVPAGQTRAFSNALPNANPHIGTGAAVYYNGTTNSGSGLKPNSGPGSFDQSASVNWQVQQGYTASVGTFVSIITAGAMPVTITFE
jgi:hypothetical protein